MTTIGRIRKRPFLPGGRTPYKGDEAYQHQQREYESREPIREIKAGTTLLWAGSSAPEGWLECDGSDVDRRIYKELFTVIGEAFGAGDGSRTFTLPSPAAPAGFLYVIKT